ncbi:MAG TPA: Spy/CpxP family protein refolding chaperone [Pyrinomonadaceae bacterium]|jgi:Spy/CpxP family protein refolding chaperone|nr:Spy/CpxP family protein refolding chaperone [Pyrinomonadaceae bacterium]
MKRRLPQLLFRGGAKILRPAVLAIFLIGVPTSGQQQQPSEGAMQQQQQAAQVSDAINLVQELNLTADQQTQIRALKEEHEAPIREALQRRRRAQRALDEAIYADRADEATIQTHSRELGDAQADLARLRTAVELRIRRILTPEQLQRFREIRQQQQLQRAGALIRRNRERRMLMQRGELPTGQNDRQLRRERRRQERQLERMAKPPASPRRP